MKKKLFLSILILLTGCTNYVPFTSELRRSLDANNVDLRKIQFFSNKDFILKRDSKYNASTIEKGNVETNKTFIRETITFSSSFSNLAGVCVDTEPYALGIAFEEGNPENKKIMFLEDRSGYYVYNSENKLIYDNVPYDVKQGRGAKLLVSSKQTSKYKTSRRKIKGLYVE